jgi:large subunit ribosomal protein L25
MARLTLETEVRSETKKGAMGRLRATGTLPAIMYGAGEDPLKLSLNFKEFDHALHSISGEHAVVDLKMSSDGTTQTVLIKSVQRHPMDGNAIHVDFLRVRMDQTIETTIRVTLVGISKGIKDQGGVMDQLVREIEVECLPGDLPDHVEIDVTELLIGDALHVSDLELPEKVKCLTPAERAIVHVMVPRVVEEVEVEAEEEVEEGAEGEPERVGGAEEDEKGGEEAG